MGVFCLSQWLYCKCSSLRQWTANLRERSDRYGSSSANGLASPTLCVVVLTEGVWCSSDGRPRRAHPRSGNDDRAFGPVFFILFCATAATVRKNVALGLLTLF